MQSRYINTTLCSACHKSVLHTFISIAKASLQASPDVGKVSTGVPQHAYRGAIRIRRYSSGSALGNTLRPVCIRNAYAAASVARFATSASIREDNASLSSTTAAPTQAKDHVVDANETTASPEDGTTSTTNPDSDLPWYLQGKPAETTAYHALPGQDMPDIPDHSPSLLEPIVKHTLETLGLSYLAILDLRSIRSPPPALGSNLIMVVATARSERHLHASADRMCRWLRSTYKLRPVADGLLGRNEMKIAVRRRLRKAKMLSAVGAGGLSEGNIEDGIRSGWICLNVGRVDGGGLPDAIDYENTESFEASGKSSQESTIVVQMMTESKREELDLENLWMETKRRQDKKLNSLTAEPEAGNENDQVYDSPTRSWAPAQPYLNTPNGDGTTTYQPFLHNHAGSKPSASY